MSTRRVTVRAPPLRSRVQHSRHARRHNRIRAAERCRGPPRAPIWRGGTRRRAAASGPEHDTKRSPLPMSSTPQPAGDANARLSALRRGLVRLHKALVDFERIEYERLHGRATSAELLQVLIGDPRSEEHTSELQSREN